MVKRAYGVDISDQRNPSDVFPHNFKLIVYDGYDLSAVPSDSMDLVFSDQLIEHFHPEDTRLHFETTLRILKPGGRYVFRTPHAQTGPHDVSKYFSDVAEGFHLKEWTYAELALLLKEIGYSSFRSYAYRRGKAVRLPLGYFFSVEKVLSKLPTAYARPVANRLIATIFAAAVK